MQLLDLGSGAREVEAPQVSTGLVSGQPITYGLTVFALVSRPAAPRTWAVFTEFTAISPGHRV